MDTKTVELSAGLVAHFRTAAALRVALDINCHVHPASRVRLPPRATTTAVNAVTRLLLPESTPGPTSRARYHPLRRTRRLPLLDCVLLGAVRAHACVVPP